MTLKKHGCLAESFTGRQAGIKTDAQHARARILDIDDAHKSQLNAGVVPVVAGFQVPMMLGIHDAGRGGSDTTSVALAAILGADECQIYTDVQGVFTADPRVVEGAKLLNLITFEEMLELASLGSKVLHSRAVEFASKYKVPLRVLSSFESGPGTLITKEEESMEQPIISGITFTRDEAKLTSWGCRMSLELLMRSLAPLAKLILKST